MIFSMYSNGQRNKEDRLYRGKHIFLKGQEKVF
jgi:hypothetical protein